MGDVAYIQDQIRAFGCFFCVYKGLTTVAAMVVERDVYFHCSKCMVIHHLATHGQHENKGFAEHLVLWLSTLSDEPFVIMAMVMVDGNYMKKAPRHVTGKGEVPYQPSLAVLC